MGMSFEVVTGLLLPSLGLASVTVALLFWPGRRPGIEAFPSRARRGMALVVLTLFLALVCWAPVFQFPDVDPEVVVGGGHFGALFVGHALLVLFLVVWWFLVGQPPLGSYLRVGPGAPWEVLRLGIGGGVMGWALTLAAMATVGLFVSPGAAGEEGAGAGVPATVEWLVALPWYQRLAVALSAGIVEEAFFRSFLQVRAGLLLSSALFTASHMSYGLPLMLVGIFTFSTFLGLLFRARNDVVPCMIAHTVFDAIQLFLILPLAVARG